MTNYSKQYAAAKKAGKIQDLTPDYVKWEKEGQQIIGAYVSQNEVDSSLSEGKYKQYLFDTDKGLIKMAMGSAADAEFSTMFVAGCIYAITYNGKEKIGRGREVNRFTVEQFELIEEQEQKPDKGPANGK